MGIYQDKSGRKSHPSQISAQDTRCMDAKRGAAGIECCTDTVLHTTMLLALGCSMRIGEILGLTWDCVDFSEESIMDGTAHVTINKELKRCQKDSLEALSQAWSLQGDFYFSRMEADRIFYIPGAEVTKNREQRTSGLSAQNGGPCFKEGQGIAGCAQIVNW